MKIKTSILAVGCGMLALVPCAFPATGDHSVFSPDSAIEVRVAVGIDLTYAILFEGRPIVGPSVIALTLDGGRTLGRSAVVREASVRPVSDFLVPVVRQKASMIPDRFNELTIEFEGSYALIVRAYDDGVAYRLRTAFPDPVTVISERAEFAFPGDPKVYFPEEESFQSHQERSYKIVSLSDIGPKRFSATPVLVAPDGGPKVLLTEADLEDYAGLWLTGSSDSPGKLVGLFPAYPLKEEAKNDRNVLVTERAPYLARTAGTRVYPWRVFLIARKDGDLIESPMIHRLAKPAEGDFTWVRPGKVAWDWWNDLNLAGVDFRAGVNTATYKFFIDFAASNRIEYVILDEGWSKLGDLLSMSPGVDVEDILAHAKARDVGIILWTTWKTLDDQFEKAMDQFTRWGVAGLKVDFMQRDDQPVVNFYSKVAAEAARRNLLLDFHGAYKPTGLSRTFPNVLTSEGVLGLEHNKWSRNVTPEHDLVLPFIRMAAGPMDYTPGAMINGGMKSFQVIYNRPMSQGTRCHQLAMYVVYESPLQMLADSPTNYLREPECLEFLSRVPSTWDETRVLAAAVGDYVLIARRHGTHWYLGAMTDGEPRELAADLSFLEDRSYEATIYADGLNADRHGEDFRRSVRTVKKGDRIELKLASGGGAAVVIVPR